MLAPVVVAGGLILAASAGYFWRGQQPPRQTTAVQTDKPADVRDLTILSGRVAELERQLSEARLPVAPEPSTVVVTTVRERELGDELARLRHDYANALAGKMRAEESTSPAAAELEQLQASSPAGR